MPQVGQLAVVRGAHEEHRERGGVLDEEQAEIDAIAQAAGVSRKTVFTAVGGKVQLLKLAYDFRMTGDDEPVPMIQRPGLQRVIAEPDPYRQLDLYAGFVAEASRRIAPLYMVLRGAAEVDAEAKELYDKWEAERHAATVRGRTSRARGPSGRISSGRRPPTSCGSWSTPRPTTAW